MSFAAQAAVAFRSLGPALLGWNQLGLLALIVVYCSWSVHAAMASAGTLAAELKAAPELTDALGSLDVNSLYKNVAVAFTERSSCSARSSRA